MRYWQNIRLCPSSVGAIVTAVTLPPMLAHRMTSGVLLTGLRDKSESRTTVLYAAASTCLGDLAVIADR